MKIEVDRKSIIRKYEMVTCGCYIIDSENRLLIVHPTGLGPEHWSIPKGLPNQREEFYDAARRELREETGIRIDDYLYDMYELGVAEYTHKHKALVGFAFFLDTVVTQRLVCHSLFQSIGLSYLPEVDEFKWVDLPEAIDYVQPEQKKLFESFTF